MISDSEVREADSRVDDCRRRRDTAQSEVNSASSAVSSAQSQINPLTSQCQQLEHQSKQYNEEVMKMKVAMLFFRKASQFWKEFQNISKRGADRTALLQKIISKAKEEQDLSWFDSGASKLVGKSFFDAWKMIETKCEQGVNAIFQIEQ